MYGFIYLTTNKVNNKKYIGMCKNTHSKNYIGSGTILKEAVKKYGKENFSRIILEKCNSFDELCKAEKKWIKKYNAVEDNSFYNLTEGGFGGNSNYMKDYWSEFTKEERKTSRKWSKRNINGKNNPMYGKKHSDETKKKIGLKSVNRNWNKPNHKGTNNPNSKNILVYIDDKILKYGCLKQFCDEYKKVPYPTLKSIAKDGRFSKKYNLKIEYA